MPWLFRDSAVCIYESILPQLSSHPGHRWAEFPCAQHWYFWTYHSTVILFHFFFWMAKRTTSHKIRVGFPGYVHGWEIKFSVSIASISFFLVSFNAISSDLHYPPSPHCCNGNLTSGSKDLKKCKNFFGALVFTATDDKSTVHFFCLKFRAQYRAQSWEAGRPVCFGAICPPGGKNLPGQEASPKAIRPRDALCPEHNKGLHCVVLSWIREHRQVAIPTLWPDLTLGIKVLTYISEKLGDFRF